MYSNIISDLSSSLKMCRELEAKRQLLTNKYKEAENAYTEMVEAQKLISLLSDKNTNETLNYISGMVNKTLSEIFPMDKYYVKLERKLYQNRPHITLELHQVDNSGVDHILDAAYQSGTGVSQVISFMYVICLIEIRKGRRLVILDERLNGLHLEAKRIIAKIIELFAKGGFQFIFVEYSLNNLGKTYNVERHEGSSYLQEFEGEYKDDIIYVSDVDLSLLNPEGEDHSNDLDGYEDSFDLL